MKEIEVVAAIIKRDNYFFSTQRGYGEFEGMWEFPGGKIEPGESRKEALIREIKEELDVMISVDEFLCTVTYQYPHFHLTMHCFICTIIEGKIELIEHSSAKWLSIDTLGSVEWLPADIDVVESLIQRYEK